MDEALQIVADHGALPFDLERGPLYRFIVVSIDENQHIFGASFHHIVTDGEKLHHVYHHLYSACWSHLIVFLSVSNPMSLSHSLSLTCL